MKNKLKIATTFLALGILSINILSCSGSGNKMDLARTKADYIIANLDNPPEEIQKFSQQVMEE